MNAIFKDRHKTIGNTGSEKKRAKLANVNCNVKVLFPSRVKAYSTIMTIGRTIMTPAQTRYG